jgi:hypothetical protein
MKQWQRQWGPQPGGDAWLQAGGWVGLAGVKPSTPLVQGSASTRTDGGSHHQEPASTSAVPHRLHH